MIANASDECVEQGFACPHCGERRMDLLVWVEDDCVECETCGHHYDPAGEGGDGHDPATR